MSDPLSIAASVAGLLALTGTVSKSVFQFVTSIKDAPEDARTLVRSLYTLNVVFGQIQQNTLDPDFISETDDKDVEELQRCLANCTSLFTQLQKKVEARTRHMSRQLKDITITLQWLLPKVPGQRAAPITSAEQKAVESSVFAASSAYNADELATCFGHRALH